MVASSISFWNSYGSYTLFSFLKVKCIEVMDFQEDYHD